METPRVPRGGCGCVNHPFGESEPPVTPGGVDLRLVPSWVNLELAQVTRESSKRGWRKGRIGADGSAAQLSAQGAQCTGRYLGRAGGPGPLTATSWGSALARPLSLGSLFVLLEGLIVAVTWLAAAPKVRWTVPSRKGRAVTSSRKETKIPHNVFPGCVLTNIYGLKFICSILVLLLLCFVILGCDLLQNTRFGSFVW